MRYLCATYEFYRMFTAKTYFSFVCFCIFTTQGPQLEELIERSFTFLSVIPRILSRRLPSLYTYRILSIRPVDSSVAVVCRPRYWLPGSWRFITGRRRERFTVPKHVPYLLNIGDSSLGRKVGSVLYWPPFSTEVMHQWNCTWIPTYLRIAYLIIHSNNLTSLNVVAACRKMVINCNLFCLADFKRVLRRSENTS